MTIAGQASATRVAPADLPAMQQALRDSLSPMTSCAVLDVSTGELLATVQPKILHQSLPTGSLIKPLLAWIALEKQIVPPDSSFICYPRQDAASGFPCWDPRGHGQVDMVKALSFSCNTYFYHVAKIIGIETFGVEMQRFGYDLPRTLTPTENLDLMIGRSEKMRMTPLQNLSYLTGLINGGRIFDWERPAAGYYRTIDVSTYAADVIRRGLEDAYLHGTGRDLRRVNLTGQPLLVKTGTGPYFYGNVTDHTRTHAWTVVFYPATQPQIGWIVFVQEGTGSHEGVQQAGRVWQILQRYLQK